MKTVRIILMVSAITAFISCKRDRVSGSGPIITEQRAIQQFTKIKSSGSTDVTVQQGTNFKVEVTGYSNLVPYYETKLVNGTLELGYRNNVNVKNDNVKVYVTLPVLNGLALAGSGNMNTIGVFNGNTFFETDISGSGNISFSQGTAQTYHSRIAGSGNVYAFGMVATDASVTISGSGNSEITANNRLNVNIAGSGNVYYKSTPVVSAQISGSGAVIPR